MSSKLRTLRRITLTVAAIAAMYPGSSIQIARQLGLYEGLRDAGAIVFGVVGAWLALVYPAALTNLRKRIRSDVDAETIIAKKLFDALLFSSIVLAVTIAVPIIRELLLASPAIWMFHTWWRAASFGLVVTLAGLLLWSLVLAVLPGEDARVQVESLDRKREYRETTSPPRKAVG